jgi:uncharacterized membrane protein YcaP (DUF421 family)
MDAITNALGLDRTDPHDLTSLQVSLRAIAVFVAGLVIMRLGNRRFLGKATPFDVMLAFLLGSVLSRAISGTAAFVPTLAGCLVIVLLHRGLAAVLVNAHWLGRLVKGRAIPIIEEGSVDRVAARKLKLTQGDLDEALRMHGVADASQVALATLERNGVITVVQRRVAPAPRRVDEET